MPAAHDAALALAAVCGDPVGMVAVER